LQDISVFQVFLRRCNTYFHHSTFTLKHTGNNTHIHAWKTLQLQYVLKKSDDNVNKQLKRETNKYTF